MILPELKHIDSMLKGIKLTKHCKNLLLDEVVQSKFYEVRKRTSNSYAVNRTSSPLTHYPDGVVRLWSAPTRVREVESKICKDGCRRLRCSCRFSDMYMIPWCLSVHDIHHRYFMKYLLVAPTYRQYSTLYEDFGAIYAKRREY